MANHSRLPTGGSNAAGLISSIANTTIDARDMNSYNSIATTNHYYGAERYEGSISDMLSWLRRVDYRIVHDKIYSRRTPGTGQWLIQSPEYENWIALVDQAFQSLECRGPPGSGKSTLASAVVEDLLARFPSKSSNRLVLYVYFRYDTQESQNVPTVLANLLGQIVRGANAASQVTAELYEEYLHHGKAQPRLDKIMATFKSELAAYEQVYIIVDALDEYCVENYDAGQDLIDCLQELGVKLLVTSRNMVPLQQGTFSRVRIHANPDDIGTFIESKIKGRLAEFCRRSPGLREEIHEKLSEKAGGMFVIPSLHMEWISHLDSPQEVRDALKELPTGLEDTYKTTMRRILSQGKREVERAIKALLWVYYTTDLFTILELRAAVSYKPGTTAIGEDSLIGEEDILSACAGLIVLAEARVWNGVQVQFVHRSTHEFFTQYSSEYFPPDPHRQIAETCLHYLVLVTSIIPKEIAQEIITSDTDFSTRDEYPHIDQFPLCSYAAAYWGFHASTASKDFDHRLISELFNRPISPYLTTRIEILPTQSMPPLHYKILYLAFFGPVASFRTHFSPEHSPSGSRAVAGNKQQSHFLCAVMDSKEYTPMHYAAISGDIEIVTILLENGADPDARSKDSETPLYLAAMIGHSDVVVLLLACGANPLLSNCDGETAWYIANKNDNRETVEMLKVAEERWTKTHGKVISGGLEYEGASTSSNPPRGNRRISKWWKGLKDEITSNRRS